MAIWRFPTRVRAQRDAIQRALYAEDGSLSQDGQRIVAWLRDFTGLHENRVRFDGTGRVDPIATAFEAGKRDVGLQFMKIANLREQDIRGARHDDTIEDDYAT